MKVEQISFTRINKEGWKIVNASPNLSSKDVAFFSNVQDGNVITPEFDDADLNKKITVELTSNDTSVFFTRIKSEVGVDEEGRSIMFANGFVSSCDEFVKNPIDILRIEESNYHFSVDETKEYSIVPTLQDVFTLKEAIESIGFTQKTFIEFAQCVHYLFTDKNATFVIICDCSLDLIKKYMLCIYKLLPFEIRKKISFSTYDSKYSTSKSILFQRRVKNKEWRYFDLNHGDNNVLSVILKNKMSRYDHVNAIAKKCFETGDSDDLLIQMEEELKRFGVFQATSLDMYKVAYGLIKINSNQGEEEYTSAVMINRLNELLNVGINHPYIDQQIQYVFADIIDGNVELNEHIFSKVMKKVASTENEDLKLCGNEYICKRLLKMSTEEAAQNLNASYPDKANEEYLRIAKVLSLSPEGQAIIDYMWIYIAEKTPPTVECIQKFYEQTLSAHSRAVVESALRDILKRYVDMVAKNTTDASVLLRNVEDLITKVSLYSYSKEVLDYTKNKYWDNFRFSRLEDVSIYELERLCEEYKVDGNRKCDVVSIIIAAIENFSFCRYRAMSDQVDEIISLIDPEDKECVGNMLLNAGLKQLKLGSVKSLSEIDCWLLCFEKFPEACDNPAKYMIEKDVNPFTRHLDEAIPRSVYFEDPDFVSKLQKWLEEYANEGTEAGRIVPDLLKILAEKTKSSKKGFLGIFGKKDK